MTPFVRQDGAFGENEVGEKAQDDRWLVGMSELHLQLHSSENHPIHLDTQSSDQQYSVRVQAIKYCVDTVSRNSIGPSQNDNYLMSV